MFPRWLSWLFVLFLAYIVFTGNWGADRGAPEAPRTGSQAVRDYPAMRALVDGERWKRSINPDYAKQAAPCAALAHQEGRLGSYAIFEEAGHGEPARCGDRVRFALTLWDRQGRPGRAFEKELTLGKQPGLDALLVGMAPGETRLLVLPVPGAGYKALPELKKGQLHLLRVQWPSEPAETAHPE